MWTLGGPSLSTLGDPWFRNADLVDLLGEQSANLLLQSFGAYPFEKKARGGLHAQTLSLGIANFFGGLARGLGGSPRATGVSQAGGPDAPSERSGGSDASAEGERLTSTRLGAAARATTLGSARTRTRQRVELNGHHAEASDSTSTPPTSAPPPAAEGGGQRKRRSLWAAPQEPQEAAAESTPSLLLPPSMPPSTPADFGGGDFGGGLLGLFSERKEAHTEPPGTAAATAEVNWVDRAASMAGFQLTLPSPLATPESSARRSELCVRHISSTSSELASPESSARRPESSARRSWLGTHRETNEML